MTTEQRNIQLKKLLVDQKQVLLAAVKKAMGDKLNEDIRLSFEEVQDNPDKSVYELLKHVNAAIMGNKSEEIDHIDAALHKLEDGTYGTCDECGEEIPLGRLKVVPFAVHCVNCQRDIDAQKGETRTWEGPGDLQEDQYDLKDD
ncbi:MAG: hypothetical protein GY868_17730 [Deltaproteobacteria bacterium]|nr:hypothetical protein [Deltaproteobacteria bacterium]